MKIINKRAIAGLELVIMITSMFAFSYMVYMGEDSFKEFEKKYEEAKKGKPSVLSVLAQKFLSYSRKPMFALASAADSDCDGRWPYCQEEMDQIQQYGAILTEEETRTSFQISAGTGDNGCCGLTKEGIRCVTTSTEQCAEYFAGGALCSETSFCQKGCCYDETLGIYDQNVLRVNCPKSWNTDSNCNLPSAKRGCCVLGTSTIFETEKQCEIDTINRALGPNSTVDWRSGVNEMGCVLLSSTQNEGACVLDGGNCKFVTETECLNYKGDFNEGTLCTASSLNSACNMTELTTCVEGKDEVYFVDSCGNRANIYDSSKVRTQSYWEEVVSPAESCGKEFELGNARSKSCGNCNRVLGGICSSAIMDDFEPNLGNYYCKATSCTFKGETYKNGESWCVYDGAIGNGDDVVGSRHWKYVCSYGEVLIEPCADYRNQICIQQDTFDYDGREVTFRNSACVANNWRECIDINGREKEEGAKKCEETLNCRIEHVDIADKFKFDICTPKYPGGFSVKDPRYQKSSEQICGMASQTCTVIYKQKFMGGCEIAANGNCLKEGFAQKMNDLCRKLGDCGLEVNTEGVYTENYKVTKSPGLSDSWISKLVALSQPVPGQHAEVENYTEFLEAAGLFGNAPGAPGEEDDPESPISMGYAMGVVGLGYVAGVIATGSLTLSYLSVLAANQAGLWAGGYAAGPGMAGFAGAAMGAGIGMIAGMYLAKALGLSPMGTLLMTIGGGMVGGVIGYYLVTGNPIIWTNPFLLIGVLLLLVALFFMGADCDPVEVTFECKVWQPPVGGSDCEKCGEDPLKPCSDYRCETLGAACALVNKGTNQELCMEDNPNDVTPPTIEPYLGVISSTEIYDDVSENGFTISSTNGGCVDAYTPLLFGIVTNEPAKCRFDVEQKDFSEMSFDLGGNFYIYNHTTTFTLPDPSHGQSQGADWSGDLTLYIKCEDTHGKVSPGFYSVDMCVNQGPDKMPPAIRATSPINGGLVGYAKSSHNLSVVTNELATCKWDSTDKEYNLMANSMSCIDTLAHPTNPKGYVCNTEVPVNSPENTYYIRCMDQPWLEIENKSSERNPNTQSYVFTLKKPTKAITIDYIKPNENLDVPTEYTSVNIEAQTSGGGEYHKCSYSFSGYINMIEMFETGAKRIHNQPINLAAKTHNLYIRCVDETGEFAQNQTEFKMTQDTSTPQIARVWQEGGIIHLITTENSECVYNMKSCRYSWDQGNSTGTGKEHTINGMMGQTYYIKCRDGYLNTPNECSIMVQAG